MPKKNARVNAYIARSAEFAKPILKYLRAVVHEGCPGAAEEIKWGFPHFQYKGMLASMASFKAHCAFGFWKGRLVLGAAARSRDAMGDFGRITRISDLPPRKTLVRYVRNAAALNDAGVNARRAHRPKPVRPLRVPADLNAALARNRKARAFFDALSPSNKRDYVNWLTEAKAKETRNRRLATAVAWIEEGKIRNWKYVRR